MTSSFKCRIVTREELRRITEAAGVKARRGEPHEIVSWGPPEPQMVNAIRDGRMLLWTWHTVR